MTKREVQGTVKGRTVLFVDDDEMVLRSLDRALRDEQYNSLFANGGKEALEILKRNEVHVMVTDMCMPDMLGFELLRIVKKEYPYITRMVLSGYTEAGNILKAVNEGEVFRYIPKPWKLEEEFKPAVRQGIDYYDLHNERHPPKKKFEPENEQRENDQSDTHVKSPYEVLSISPNTTQEEIRKAYKSLAVQYHPDKTAHLGPELRELADKKMKEINGAYKWLSQSFVNQ